MRYVLTGGDNCYCCTCGGICDRMLLEIDDDAKTYRAFDNAICLGKYCWHTKLLSDGKRLMTRDVWVENNKVKRGVFVMTTDDYYAGKRAHEFGQKIAVKNNKYGKDGEFGDKLDHYTCMGLIKEEGDK